MRRVWPSFGCLNKCNINSIFKIFIFGKFNVLFLYTRTPTWICCSHISVFPLLLLHFLRKIFFIHILSIYLSVYILYTCMYIYTCTCTYTYIYILYIYIYTWYILYINIYCTSFPPWSNLNLIMFIYFKYIFLLFSLTTFTYEIVIKPHFSSNPRLTAWGKVWSFSLPRHMK